MKKIKNGFFIVCEGIDGSGKSTLVKLLAEKLEDAGHTVLATREPGATRLGKEVRRMVQEGAFHLTPQAEFLLFAADRAQHVEEVIRPALEQGMIVISDRFVDSSLVYQGSGRGLDKSVISAVNNWVCQGLAPDLTIYCMVDVETSEKRIASRGKKKTVFEQEGRSFLERLVQGFEEIYSERNDVVVVPSHVHGPEALADMAFSAVEKHLLLSKEK